MYNLLARCVIVFAQYAVELIFNLFLSRDAMLARYMLSSCVCLSVCHMPALYQNG